jgi:hypothetical protein
MGFYICKGFFRYMRVNFGCGAAIVVKFIFISNIYASPEYKNIFHKFF